MRRRRQRLWLVPIVLRTWLLGQDGAAQTVPVPTAPALDPPAPSADENSVGRAMPPAPQPIPGPADVGLPLGGMDAQAPQGLPINLATAMQLAGARPLDIAAATKQVEQALALQFQARVLWVPT